MWRWQKIDSRYPVVLGSFLIIKVQKDCVEFVYGRRYFSSYTPRHQQLTALWKFWVQLEGSRLADPGRLQFFDVALYLDCKWTITVLRVWF